MPARICLAFALAAAGINCITTTGPSPEPGPHACVDFLSRTDFDVSVMDAELMNAGTETEYCWVDAMIRPNIRFGASLPADWNGRFVMRGGGGYAGQQPAKGRDDPLRDRGYVTASTDTGHDAARYPLASFAYNNRDGEIDYAYRAVHLTAVAVKELIGEYYGRPAAYDYWLGCSTGGRQGLMSAQRFPEDFDGIVAGAPVLDFTNTQIGGVWFSQALRENPVSLEKIARVGEAIYAACDHLDGLEDGLIDDPRQCAFDPRTDYPRCGAEDRVDCLTEGESTALAKIYGGVVSRGSRTSPASRSAPSSATHSDQPPRGRADGAVGSSTPARTRRCSNASASPSCATWRSSATIPSGDSSSSTSTRTRTGWTPSAASSTRRIRI